MARDHAKQAFPTFGRVTAAGPHLRLVRLNMTWNRSQTPLRCAVCRFRPKPIPCPAQVERDLERVQHRQVEPQRVQQRALRHQHRLAQLVLHRLDRHRRALNQSQRAQQRALRHQHRLAQLVLHRLNRHRRVRSKPSAHSSARSATSTASRSSSCIA